MYETNESSHLEEFDTLRITDNAIQYLTSTANWAKFLSIVGFIGIGFMVLAGLVVALAGSYLTSAAPTPYPFPISWLGGFYLVFAGLYFFPILYLYKFSNATLISMKSKDSMDLEFALLNLKSHYRYLGIFVIVILSMYALAIVGAIIFGATGAFGV